MTKKQTILVLDETERSMIVEAFYNYLNYGFVSFFNKKNKDDIALLEKLNENSGGFRLVTGENSIHFISIALRWNGEFILSQKERTARTGMNKYSELSYILPERNKHLYLFSDFDPKAYTLNTQLKPFKKFDFTQTRFLLIRFQNGEMEFIREFYREPDEADTEYIQRANGAVIKENMECIERAKDNPLFLNMKYQAVEFKELGKFKLKKDFSYHG